MRLANFRQLSPERQKKEVQKAIENIKLAEKELDSMGIWDLPKKIEKNKTYTIWKRKE